ncbi:MAG: helix-turn-helix domain-containing protein [Pseudohongiellaceae bacterium]
MDERLSVVARLLDGDKMAALCREFMISRKTGYKTFNGYKEVGIQGLEAKSRRPYRHATKLPFQIEKMIVRIKQEHPNWGAPKIRDKLFKTYPMFKPPAKSTVHAVLHRHGYVKRRMPCAALTTKSSSCSATNSTAIL